MMQRLLYISESRIEPSDAEAVVSKIVAHAQIKNEQLGLTGAMIFTGQHFAQVLEGPANSIQKLMAEIADDPRHGSITVVDRTPITSRQFANWRMAYQGPSQFVSRRVERLLHTTSPSERQRAADWLTDLAREFSAN